MKNNDYPALVHIAVFCFQNNKILCLYLFSSYAMTFLVQFAVLHDHPITQFFFLSYQIYVYFYDSCFCFKLWVACLRLFRLTDLYLLFSSSLYLNIIHVNTELRLLVLIDYINIYILFSLDSMSGNIVDLYGDCFRKIVFVLFFIMLLNLSLPY